MWSYHHIKVRCVVFYVDFRCYTSLPDILLQNFSSITGFLKLRLLVCDGLVRFALKLLFKYTIMEGGVSEQAVSHVRVTFPKRIFEVCYLMRRETETEFLGTDVSEEFTKEIRLNSYTSDHVSISLSVDHLSFEDNNICFFVDKVKPKDEQKLESCLDKYSTSSRDLKLNDGTTSIALTDAQEAGQPEKSLFATNETDTGKVKRKRGRPRKDQQLTNDSEVSPAGPAATTKPALSTTETDAEKEKDGNQKAEILRNTLWIDVHLAFIAINCTIHVYCIFMYFIVNL